ncbi:carbohydrate ABC transporter permease [Cohnella sp. WQ 127256]|uniref:carbohydrate ABC transporter permease n=1 Tax=Cohnella sp. WQ 127256 TaxID=2938790 RepID=UPI00211785CB|nr:carbohydrate ABC transporter permease [Cohnella sp. WQ 127256]
MSTKLPLKLLAYLLLIILTLFTLIPFYSMIVMGTYDSFKLYLFNGLPSDYFIHNLESVLKVKEMGRFFLNSLTVSAISVAGAIFTATACGYGLSKYSFKGRRFLNNLVLFTMMVPSQLGLVAYVWEMNKLHLIDTLIPTILPMFSLGFGVFWMTQYIRDSVPTEIIESGRIDSAGEFRIFFSLAFPIITPAVVTLGLLAFIWSWNSFLIPLLTISDVRQYTIPLGVTMFNGLYVSDNGAKILALTIATLPVLLFYLFFSKQLMSGLTAGAVKG